MTDKFKSNLKIALQLFSVREDMAGDFEGCLKKVKEMGYDGVEFAGLHGNSAKDVKSMLEKVGLMPVSAHVSMEEMLADPEKVFSDYKEIGCEFIVIPYLGAEYRPEAGSFDKTLETIRTLSEKAKEKGLKMLYHNHDFEFTKIDGEYYLDTIFRKLEGVLDTEIDTCWANVGGENPADYVRKYKGRADVVHLKDFVSKDKIDKEGLYELIGIKTELKENESFAFRPVGEGLQKVEEILDACEDVNCRYVIVEQDSPCLDYTPLECAKRSITNLKNILK